MTTRKRASELLARVGLNENPDTKIKDIGVGKQQLVEIAKALSKDVKLLILDEPTSALNEGDSQHLLGLIAGLRAQGRHLHHDQPQAQRDRADLRLDHHHPRRQVPSRPSASRRTASTRTGSSAAWSVATSSPASPTTSPSIGEVLFEVKNWTVRAPERARTASCAKSESFFVRRGEIVGFAGLMGAGRTELMRSIFGQSYGIFVSGTLLKDGQELQPQVGPRGDRRRPRLRHRGPQDPRPQPPRRHQAHHRLGQAEADHPRPRRRRA